MANFSLKDIPAGMDARLEDAGAAQPLRPQPRELREAPMAWAGSSGRPTGGHGAEGRPRIPTQDELRARLERLRQFHRRLGRAYTMDDEVRRQIAEVRAAHEAGVRLHTPDEEARLNAELEKDREESGTWFDPAEVDALIHERRM